VQVVPAALAREEPGLCVEARALDVVRDAHLGAGQPRERLDRAELRRAREHRGEHAQAPAAVRERLELGRHLAEPSHRDERGDHVHRVGRGDLGLELVAQARVGGAPREQRALGERGQRPRGRERTVDGAQALGAGHVLAAAWLAFALVFVRVGLFEQRDEPVRERELGLGVSRVTEAHLELPRDVTREDPRQIGLVDGAHVGREVPHGRERRCERPRHHVLVDALAK
jgi:hypothetical protein